MFYKTNRIFSRMTNPRINLAGFQFWCLKAFEFVFNRCSASTIELQKEKRRRFYVFEILLMVIAFHVFSNHHKCTNVVVFHRIMLTRYTRRWILVKKIIRSCCAIIIIGKCWSLLLSSWLVKCMKWHNIDFYLAGFESFIRISDDVK